MTNALHQPARQRLAASVLQKHLGALEKHLPGVRTAEDIESVHQMRVASRRTRTALALFDAALPGKTAKRWLSEVKRVTKALGAARDLDVQIEFLDEFIATLNDDNADLYRIGLERLRGRLVDERAAMQGQAVAAMDTFEGGGVLPALKRWVRQAAILNDADPRRDPIVRGEAIDTIGGRLETVLSYDDIAGTPDNIEGLHDLRIAAKRLRYALEAYDDLLGGLRSEIKCVKQIQTVLGDLHDCDVWIELLPRAAGDLVAEAVAAGDGRQPATEIVGLEYLLRDRRSRRAALYDIFWEIWQRDQEADVWSALRIRLESLRWTAPVGSGEGYAPSAPRTPPWLKTDGVVMTPPDKRFAEFDAKLSPIAAERMRPVYALAEACDYEVEHAHQVTRLALRLFDELTPLHGLDDARRFWLAAAGILHDIGWIEGGKGHHKVALRFILQSDMLPWDDRMRLIVGSIARYHRKALPKTSHEHFMALGEQDRQDVRKLAGLLRLADGLDYTHKSAVQDLACEIGQQQIVVRCACPQPANIELSRAMKKRDLAESVFGREFIVACRLLGPSPADPS